MLKSLWRELFGARRIPPAAPGHAAEAKLATAQEDCLAGATVSFSRGDYTEAERQLDACLALCPDSAAVLFALSATYHRQGRLRRAARTGLQALARDSSRTDVSAGALIIFDELSRARDRESPAAPGGDDFVEVFAAGNDLLAEGDLAGAEALFLRCHAIQPDWPLTYQRLGCLCAVRGDLEAADGWFARSAAAGLKPDTNIRLSSAFLGPLRACGGAIGSFDVQSGCPGVLFVSGDAVYFRRFAHSLVASALAHGNAGFLWHFHLVNPDEWIELEFAELASFHPGTLLRLTTERRAFATAEEAKTYYSCARFVMLHDMVRRYAKPVVLLDFDLLILRPLGQIVEEHQHDDIALMRWGERRWRIWDQFWASAVIAYPGARALRFLGCVSGYVAHFIEAGKGAWYLDQIALFAAFCRNGREPEPACIGRIDPAACAVHHIDGAEPHRPVAFWSVSFNVQANAGALQSDLFRRFLPRTRSLFGWRLPGTDLVFQDYLARGRVYRGRRMWDLDEMEFALSRLTRRRRAIDVGAHVGFWSFWLADHFAAVEAFEPHPLIEECFEANVARENVRLHRVAVGRSGGVAALSLDPTNTGMTHILPGAAGTIPVEPLDRHGFDDVDFLKIDAEGYELAVLEGARTTIAACKPLILIEQDERWSQRYGDVPKAALQWLERLGARVIAEFPESNYLVGWKQ